MYGKAYEAMYAGSMVGAGLNVFAVWNYIIAKCHFGVIELNPKLLHAILGGKLEEVVEAIEYLSRPDPDSRSKDEDGRRIVKEGQFQYRVVNWEAYQRMRREEDLREYNRLKQADYRRKKKEKGEARASKRKGKEKPLTNVGAIERAEERGDTAKAEYLAHEKP